jgi:hypothetical protein
MWNTFFTKTYKRISFEDVQYAIKESSTGNCLLINTMPVEDQGCLIKGTLAISSEENIINELIGVYEFNRRIILYGKNTTDSTVEKKYDQLTGLGFSNVYIYTGGMFEWMLLQDIYGTGEFPTTTKILDILKYRGERKITL